MALTRFKKTLKLIETVRPPYCILFIILLFVYNIFKEIKTSNGKNSCTYFGWSKNKEHSWKKNMKVVQFVWLLSCESQTKRDTDEIPNAGLKLWAHFAWSLFVLI